MNLCFFDKKVTFIGTMNHISLKGVSLFFGVYYLDGFLVAQTHKIFSNLQCFAIQLGALQTQAFFDKSQIVNF